MQQHISRPRVAVDAVVLAALVVGAGLAFGPAYGGSRYLLTLGLGALLGAVAAAVPVLLRWPGWMTLPIAAVGYLLVGPLAATPTVATAGVLPSLESTRLLARGVISSWKQMLTIAVPVGDFGALLLPAFLLALLLTTAAVLLALRTTVPLLALLGPVLMGIGAAAFGTTTAVAPAIAGTALGLAGLVWAAWRRRASGKPGLELRRPTALALLVIPAVAAGALLTPVLAPAADRAVLRTEVVPPFDASKIESTLKSYRGYVRKTPNDVEVVLGGVPKGGLFLGMSTMTDYNGLLMSVNDASGRFAPIGGQLNSDGDTPGQQVQLTVQVQDYTGPWVFTAGQLRSLEFTGARANQLQQGLFYNRDTGSALVRPDLQNGDGYRLAASVPTTVGLDDLSASKGLQVDTSVPIPTATNVPTEVRQRANDWGGDSTDPTDITRALLTATSQEHGWWSHGASGEPASAGGHGADRIRALLTNDTMYGDAEQYSVAAALMLWERKIPARVVMGFRPTDAGTVTLRGKDMTAWVEVPFRGRGWLPLDPNPSEQKPPPTQKPGEAPSAAAQNTLQNPPPPIPATTQQQKTQDQPKKPSQASKSKQAQQEQTSQQSSSSSFPWWLLLVIAGALLLVLLPLLVIWWLKRRRRKRLATGPPERRIAGGWTYLMGSARDFGRTVRPGATRSEIAKEWYSRPPGSKTAGSRSAAAPVSAPVAAAPGEPAADRGSGVALLARDADNQVFAPDPVPQEAADAYWAAVDRELASLRRAHTPVQRLRAMLSLRSLRFDRQRKGSAR